MTIPVKKDTAPPAMQSKTVAHFYNSRKIAEYLDETCETCPKGNCSCPISLEWLRAAALEAYTAFTETLDMWVTTLIQGRPWDMPLVEWEARDLKDTGDVAEMLAEMGEARRAMAEAEREGLS